MTVVAAPLGTRLRSLPGLCGQLPFVRGLPRLLPVPLVRRLTAIVLGVALLHLSAARADASCASHRATAAQAESGQMPAHDMDHESDASRGSSCDTPAQAQCCQLLASCSVVLGATTPAQISSPARSHDEVISVGAERPASLFTAPEPPPPRA